MAADGPRLTVRPLDRADADAYRALRLEALRYEGEKFGPTVEEEAALSPADWQKRVTPTADTCLFGLFDGQQLVGIMRATVWDEDPTGQTALWGQAYVKPAYRNQRGRDGLKLTTPLYAAREAWTRQHPRYTRAVLFIEETNAISQRLHEKHGAEFIFTRQMDWPGRKPSLWHFYRIDFALSYLAETLHYLQQEKPETRGASVPLSALSRPKLG